MSPSLERLITLTWSRFENGYYRGIDPVSFYFALVTAHLLSTPLSRYSSRFLEDLDALQSTLEQAHARQLYAPFERS